MNTPFVEDRAIMIFQGIEFRIEVECIYNGVQCAELRFLLGIGFLQEYNITCIPQILLYIT